MSSRPSLRNFWIALSLGLGLGILSYSRIIGDTQSIVFRSEVLDTIFTTSIWGSQLMWNLVGFTLAMTALHIGYGALCYVVGWSSAQLAGAAQTTNPHKTERQHVLLWFSFLTIAILAFNAANFPRSSLGSPYAKVAFTEIAGARLGTLLAALIALGAISVVVLALGKRLASGWRPLRSRTQVAIAAAFFLAVAVPLFVRNTNFSHNEAEKTNVVLIGIDSLRCDIVGGYGPADAAPHLREFLKQSVWFTDTTTPLARTFPSMLSILTGRHPHKTGAYMNLPPRRLIREGDTLGRIFSRAGYHSVYAMDEVRFANIDTSYGFDQVISPPIGATEFLLSMVADTPLSNTIVNTTLGQLLFPHIYANRGAAGVYDPDEFIERIDEEVEFGKPLFIATHLTLSHWPYIWADAPPPGPKGNAVWPDYYLKVTRRVDRQFDDLMQVLRDRGVLDNAIVVLYSDHGESFGKPIEALTPPNDPLITALAAIPQWGHGSSVLSTHQFKVVLGMRGFGPAAKLFAAPRVIDSPVATLDIAPTLTELANAQTTSPFDGSSLVPLLNADAASAKRFAQRVRFTETEYTPVGVATQEGTVSTSGVNEAARIYLIDPDTDRLEVRQEFLANMLGKRQYAALGHEYLLAAVPYGSEGLSHHFLVLNKSGGLPRLLSGAPTPEMPPELRVLWDAMQTQFQGILPSAEHLEKVVAISAVAHHAQSMTPEGTK